MVFPNEIFRVSDAALLPVAQSVQTRAGPSHSYEHHFAYNLHAQAL